VAADDSGNAIEPQAATISLGLAKMKSAIAVSSSDLADFTQKTRGTGTRRKRKGQLQSVGCRRCVEVVDKYDSRKWTCGWQSRTTDVQRFIRSPALPSAGLKSAIAVRSSVLADFAQQTRGVGARRKRKGQLQSVGCRRCVEVVDKYE